MIMYDRIARRFPYWWYVVHVRSTRISRVRLHIVILLLCTYIDGGLAGLTRLTTRRDNDRSAFSPTRTV